LIFLLKKKIQQTPNFDLISPTKMNMKTKQLENINTVTKKNKKNNSNETSVEHLLYIGLFLVTVDVISKYSLPIQHEVILKKNGGCITSTSHNKRGEHAYYTTYTGK
jgi:hypothetical protein